MLRLVGDPHRNAELFLRRMVAGNSTVDRQIVRCPEIKAMLIDNYLEATRAGVRGFAQDALILSRPWGFRLEDIPIPMYLWHGAEDANVSLSAVATWPG